MNVHGLSDSVGGVIESPAKCSQCGATTRLGMALPELHAAGGTQDDCESSRESLTRSWPKTKCRTHWQVGNYEILEDGGMGVIIAHVSSSRRIVAPAGLYQADSRETLERSGVKLKPRLSRSSEYSSHHEVGQGEDGLPFFTMKYAAGGSCKSGPPRGEPRNASGLW